MRSAYAVLERGSDGSDRRRPGVLYLTTERLIFEAPGSRGLVRDLVQGREVDLVLDHPLGSLRHASVREGRWARARLVLEIGSRRSVFDVLEPAAWSGAIAEARHRAMLATSGSATSSPRSDREAGSRARCRYCGGLLDGRAGRCPSCGAPA